MDEPLGGEFYSLLEHTLIKSLAELEEYRHDNPLDNAGAVSN